MALGPLVGCALDRVRKRLGESAPSAADAKIVERWKQFNDVKTAGREIGFVERPIFFAAIWLGLVWLIPVWLVMKTAFYWQGANFTGLPNDAPSADAMAWQAAKRRYGTARASIALIGTGANIIAGLIGVAAGKWITLIAAPGLAGQVVGTAHALNSLGLAFDIA